MYTYKFLWLALLVLVLSFAGCQKFVAVDPPSTQMATATVFNDQKAANSAVAGMYAYMCQTDQIFSGLATLLTGLSADELIRPAVPADAFATNSIPTDDNNVSKLWASPYSTIYQANSIIEGLESSNSIPTEVKRQYRGEALFIRAFCHFYLVNYFGAVPIIITTDIKTTSVLPRSPADEVYRQVRLDLEESAKLLASDFLQYSGGERVRATKWAATALLARLCLYRNDWAGAEQYATELISNKDLFELPANLRSVFLKGSREAIWQFATYGSDGHTLLGNQLVPSSSAVVPDYALPKAVTDSFESADQRSSAWIGLSTVNGTQYRYPYKYKQRLAQGSATLAEYDVVLRLAEQYLIRAEARAQMNILGTETSGATSDLNAVRLRAGLKPLTFSDKNTLLLAVERERFMEFFAEWGHRWLDLKRTGRANVVLAAVKPSWKPTAVLFPVPELERNKNKNLTQNQGY